ncbi:hypothetical protein GCM10009839_71720 [Catenulispora yoronensis]|uniref:Uncharacterized protein n=1 Tax=Catenulispora yoronensis TaxID=450799 RepID=A0ABN2V6Y3_9ACTN
MESSRPYNAVAFNISKAELEVDSKEAAGKLHTDLAKLSKADQVAWSLIKTSVRPASDGGLLIPPGGSVTSSSSSPLTVSISSNLAATGEELLTTAPDALDCVKSTKDLWSQFQNTKDLSWQAVLNDIMNGPGSCYSLVAKDAPDIIPPVTRPGASGGQDPGDVIETVLKDVPDPVEASKEATAAKAAGAAAAAKAGAADGGADEGAALAGRSTVTAAEAAGGVDVAEAASSGIWSEALGVVADALPFALF